MDVDENRGIMVVCLLVCKAFDLLAAAVICEHGEVHIWIGFSANVPFAGDIGLLVESQQVRVVDPELVQVDKTAKKPN